MTTMAMSVGTIYSKPFVNTFPSPLEKQIHLDAMVERSSFCAFLTRRLPRLKKLLTLSLIVIEKCVFRRISAHKPFLLASRSIKQGLKHRISLSSVTKRFMSLKGLVGIEFVFSVRMTKKTKELNANKSSVLQY